MKGDQAILSLMRRSLPKRMYIRMQRSYRKKKGLPPSIDDLMLLLEDKRTDPELRAMVESFVSHDVDQYLSKFWLQMAQNHVQKLLESGFQNFKQTIAVEYFTFAQESDQVQPNFLKRILPQEVVSKCEEKSKQVDQHAYFSQEQSRYYNLLTILLWEYAKRQVGSDILNRLEEPSVGNPPVIKHDGRLISQDIANSTLEYQSITDGLNDIHDLATVMEVGAGYGRVAYVFLTLRPGTRYFIVDIPPGLYISQRYLSEVFPNKRVFRFKDFDSYTRVQNEIEAADVIFLAPQQLSLLPGEKMVDLFIAINCLNEMTPSIREFYFNNVNRLAKSFYFKCHKVAHTPYENSVTEQDYPVFPDWKQIYWRTCKVQEHFFEALYSM